MTKAYDNSILARNINVSGVNTNVSGLLSATSGNFTSLTVSGIPLINGGYDYEIHVSQIDGNDTTGNGDLLNPVASLTKALTLVGSQRKTIIVHPGTYTENPSITVQYTTITGPGLIGGNILLSGTLSTNTGCTIAGIKMTNLTIATPTGAGNVNILNCEISGTLTKSSNADYTVLRLCDYGSASITGAGLVAIFGGNPNFTTVNNASANIIIKSAVTVAPVLTSGTLSLVDSIVVAAVTNAITSASSSIITLANCQMLTSALSNIAPVVLSGFYSILNCVYDKTNSTLVALSATGGSTNSIDYFQYINADKFITQGGTSSQYLKGDGSLALFPDNIVYTSGNQTISGVKTFSDLPFINGTGISISGHTHTSSNITNFNTSVSGLIPITNIVAGSGINVAISGTTAIVTNNDTRWDLFLPAAPTNLSVGGGDGNATLSWTAPTGVISQAPITDYREQYSTDGGTTWTTFSAAASTATTVTVTGLTNGTTYSFRVAGVNGVGIGAYTAASSSVTPTAFIPSSISGLQLWLDAAAPETLFDATSGGSLVAANGAVARWEDRSGNARHYTQATAGNRPSRRLAVQGGRDAIGFDGSNDALLRSSSLFSNTTALSWFVVAKNADTTNGTKMLFTERVAGNDGGFRVAALPSQIYYSRNSSSSSEAVTVIENVQWPSSAVVLSMVTTASSGAARRNGVSAGTDSRTLASVAYQSLSVIGTNLQDDGGLTSAFHWNGLICEIIVYNSAISDNNRTAVESYLMTKWGIS